MRAFSTFRESGCRTVHVTLLCAAGLVAGCASTAPVASDEDLAFEAQPGPQLLDSLPRKALLKRSLAVRTGSTPSFYADTPGRRTFGMAGVVAMMREGNRLVADYRLQDPAAQLSQDLVASLASRNGMWTSSPESADLLLNVKTINWDFRPYRNDPNSLYVVYSARISLVDRRKGTVLASGKCRSQRDGEGDSATLDQLLADGASRLHSELREAAAECAQRLKSQTLSALLETVPPVAQQIRLPDADARPLR
jgi:hypothetical protein